MRGKPSLTAEAGHAGTVESEDVHALVDGCLSVMRYLKMLDGVPASIESPVWIERVRRSRATRPVSSIRS
jgi:predicted deacylase